MAPSLSDLGGPGERLDVTVPLGVARCTSDDCMRVVLDDLTAGGIHAHFGTSIEGRSFARLTSTGRTEPGES
jgi:hypothetical protein